MLAVINNTILERGQASTQDRLVIAAAFAIAFACFLRIGEITYTKFHPLKHLQRKDVLFTPHGMALRVKASRWTSPGRESFSHCRLLRI